MTYPGGAPGGYPGPGPQQPLPGPGYAPPGSGMKLGLPQILFLVVGGLSVVNFFVGFADATDPGDGFFAGGNALPALFLIGGMFVLPAIMPGGGKAGIAPAAFSVASILTVLFFVFSTSADIGVGTILMLIFGIGQTGAAVVAYLFEAGIMKPPAPQNPYGHQQPPGMYPPSGQFPAQPGQYPPPGPPGQQTTFAPQQGQFGQPGQPGTPPGGYQQQ
jgi:uncharacterized protein DUF5336